MMCRLTDRCVSGTALAGIRTLGLARLGWTWDQLVRHCLFLVNRWKPRCASSMARFKLSSLRLTGNGTSEWIGWGSFSSWFVFLFLNLRSVNLYQAF